MKQMLKQDNVENVLKDCYGLSGDTAYSAAAPDVTMGANSDLFN